MDTPGHTGYCSERCFLWDTFGVPALKEDALVGEILANQRRRHAPDGWTPKTAYPRLGEYAAWQEAQPLIIESLALIQTLCNRS